MIANGAKPFVTSIAWFLTIGLLLIAFRQFVRWRRDRVAGPVEIRPIALGTVSESTPIAELIRDRLDGAGVAPALRAGSGLGEVTVDAVDVFSASGDTGRIGTVVNGIKAALTLRTGVILTATPDTDAEADDGPFGLVVQLEEASTGQTSLIETFHGSSIRDAAINAAYGVYLSLSAREEVRRRTPSFLRWTSIAGLRHYHDGRDAETDGNLARAVDHFRKAAAMEVGNLAVQLALARAHNALAVEQVGTDQDAANRDFIAALVASLRATALSSYSVESHSQLALVAFNVTIWKDAWTSSPDRDVVCRLLGTTPTDDNLEVFFLRLADESWRKALRRTWWPSVAWAALWLDRRRTVSGLVLPFSRTRKSLHDVVLAAVVGTGYAMLVASPPGWRRRACDRTRLRMGLLAVRFGRLGGLRRALDLESLVQYNQASAYVRRAAFLRESHISDKNALKLALSHLNKAFFGPGQHMTPGDLDYIANDEDLAELDAADIYKSWRARFPTVGHDIWSERFASAASRADNAHRWWTDHLAQAIPINAHWDESGSAWARQVLTWFGDDVERWELLRQWSADPTSANARRSFEASTPPPPLNKGRSFVLLDEPRLPDGGHGDTWSSKTPTIETCVVSAWLALNFVRDLVDHHDLHALKSALVQLGGEQSERWAELRRWAHEPE